MEQICPGPVKNGHEIVSHHLHPEFGKVAQGLFVVFNVFVPGGQADFNVVMDIDAFHHVHVKAVAFNLLPHLFNLFHFPDFPYRFVMERPDQAGDAGNLFDHLLCDAVVSFAVPAKCHLHISSSFYFFCKFSISETNLYCLVIAA